jgi:hypothetical protein
MEPGKDAPPRPSVTRVLDRILNADKSQRCLRNAAQDEASRHVVTELLSLFSDEFLSIVTEGKSGAAALKYVRDGGILPAGFPLVPPGSDKKSSNLKDSGSPATYLHQTKVTKESVASKDFVGADSKNYEWHRRIFQKNAGSHGDSESGDCDWWVPYVGKLTALNGSVLQRLVDGHQRRDDSAKTFQSVVSTEGGWDQLMSIVIFSSTQLRAVAAKCHRTSLCDVTSIAESLNMVGALGVCILMDLH